MLIQSLRECVPEVIHSFPTLEPGEDPPKLEPVIFPDNLVRFQDRPRTPTYQAYTLTGPDHTRLRVHCLTVWELISPVIAYQSNAIITPGPSRTPSLRISDLRPQSSALKETAHYIPLALCLVTKGKYYDSFRTLLEELYNYITELHHDPKLGAIVANAEFVRVLSFLLNDAFLPPKCTRMTIQFGGKMVDFPIDYLYEPIHNETCLKLLIDLLDVDVLVTLWHSLLLERNVIIMGEHNNLIYGILEGLKMLIFPLKWVRTYFPLLNRSQLHLLTENKTVLIGVSTALIKYEEVATKKITGVVYNLDTGELYTLPKHCDTICSLELSQLKSSLIGLKGFSYHYYEQAGIRTGVIDSPEEGEADAWKWRRLLSVDETERTDWQITEMREAFLRPLMANLEIYSTCFTPGDKNCPGFDVHAFISRLPQCDSPTCTSKSFWLKLLQTSSFKQLIDEHSTMDESNAAVFQTLVDVRRESGCKNLFWFLRQNRSRHEIYSIVMKPELNPKGLYIQISKTLDTKSTLGCSNKFQTYLHRGKEFLHELISSTQGHPYFTEDYQDCITSVEPEKQETTPEVRLWYGERGLLKHLSLLFECLSYEDFRDLNCNEVLLQRLEREPPRAWQALVLKAYAQEALELEPVFIIRSYQLAYEMNNGWVPFHRFTKVLEAMTGNDDAQHEFQELEKSEGKLRKIANNVWRIMQDQLYEKRAQSARVSLSDEHLPEEETSVFRNPERSAERHGTGTIRNQKKLGTVLGTMRESIGGIEIRTVPLNEKASSKGPPRDGHFIVEGLLNALVRVLGKYGTKIRNGKTDKVLQLLEVDLDFKQLSISISDLQDIELVPTSRQNPNQALSLYLNLHNFIVLYSVIYKKEIPNNANDWNKFLSSVCFIVGGERMTPMSIQTLLLRAQFSQEALEVLASHPFEQLMDHPLLKYRIAEANLMVHFGLYLPTSFSPELTIFTAKAVQLQLAEQAKTYCLNTQVNELHRTVTLPALFSIKDFGSDVAALNIVKDVLKKEETGKILKKLLNTETTREVEKTKSLEDWRFTLQKAIK